jgi:hypothetical protein
MAEIVEYTLVVMVSVLFVSGSIATYDSFSAFESSLQFRADSAALARLASQAALNGSSEATLTLPSSTLGCQGGELKFTSGTFSAVQGVPLACDFTASLTAGAHPVRFYGNGSELELAVS